MRRVSEDERIVFCELVDGGPLDGSRIQAPENQKLLFYPLTVSDGVNGPGRAYTYSARWCHAYVRLEEDQFAYDGIRERRDCRGGGL